MKSVISVMTIWTLLLAAWTVTLFYSCTTLPVAQNPNPTPIENSKCVTGKWCESFDKIIESKMTPALLAYDFSREGLSNTDKVKSWKTLLKAMVKTECDYQFDQVYTENFRNEDGDFVQSIGALQLSVEDQYSYPGAKDCKGITAQSLKDPIVNFKCGMDILSAVVPRADRYWSSFYGGASWAETKKNLK